MVQYCVLAGYESKTRCSGSKITRPQMEKKLSVSYFLINRFQSSKVLVLEPYIVGVYYSLSLFMFFFPLAMHSFEGDR